MTKACVKTSGTSTTKGASVFFFGFHWSFTILEPSGKGWPLPGTPVLYASIIPVAATPTGDRPFAESAGRYEHRPQFFLSLPHRSFRDWRNGKCRDHALPLLFSNRKTR